MAEPVQVQCPSCEGSGRIPVGEHFVTKDMASDAGDPSMAGMSFGIEWGPCPDCSGDGWIASTSTGRDRGR